MLPQEKQLSDFSPLYFEFADSLAGQSFIALLNARHPSWINAAKIRLFSESCNIVSCFFYFCSDFQQSFPRFLLLTKVIQKNEPLRVRFSPFGILFNPNKIFADEMGIFYKCHLKESIAILVEFIEVVNGEITLYALPGPLGGVG